MFIPILSIVGALSFSASQYMQTDYQDYAYADDSYIESTPLPVAYFVVNYNFGHYQERDNNNFELNVNLTYSPYSISQYLFFQGYYSDNQGFASVTWYDMSINYSCEVKCYALYPSNSRLMFQGSFDLMTDIRNSGGKSFEWTGGNPNYYGDLLGYSFDFTMYQYSEQVYNAYTELNEDIASAYQQGYDDGQLNPTQEVYDEIYNQGVATGYSSGYSDGYNVAFNTDTATLTIFSGLLDIGLLPINIFLAMLNFEVFGINIGGFIMGLLTIAVTIWLLKIFMSGSGSGGSSQ